MRIRIVAVAVAACAAVLLVAGAMASGKAKPRAGSAASTATGALFAVLTGNKEIDEMGARGAGDKDGRGSFTAIVDGGKLCFGITVKNLDKPVAAHIHKGKSSANGNVVVPLTQPADGDPGASSGCVSVKSALAKAIFKNPSGYYANVHTAKFAGGAVRGQLFAKSN
jgi:CHRD domain